MRQRALATSSPRSGGLRAYTGWPREPALCSKGDVIGAFGSAIWVSPNSGRAVETDGAELVESLSSLRGRAKRCEVSAPPRCCRHRPSRPGDLISRDA
jgi:hypothetical protein